MKFQSQFRYSQFFNHPSVAKDVFFFFFYSKKDILLPQHKNNNNKKIENQKMSIFTWVSGTMMLVWHDFLTFSLIATFFGTLTKSVLLSFSDWGP